MYVCGNNRKWLETPFLRTKFLVDKDEQVVHLKEYCQFVYIDTEKGLDVENVLESKATLSAVSLDSNNVNIDAVTRLYLGCIAKLQELKQNKEVNPHNAVELDDIVNTLLPSVNARDRKLIDLTLDTANRDPARQGVDNCILGLALGVRLRLALDQHRALGVQLLNSNADSESEYKPDHAKSTSWFLASEDIVDVVSAFNWLRVRQFSQESSPILSAVQYLQSGRIPQLSAYSVSILSETIGIYSIGSIVELSNGQLAVVDACQISPQRLRLRVVTDAQKKLYAHYHYLDLPEQMDDAVAIVCMLAFDDPIIEVILQHCEMVGGENS